MRTFALALLFLTAAAVTAADKTADKATRFDCDHLQGTWKVKSVHGIQSDQVKKEFQQMRLTFEGDRVTARWGDESAEATYTLDATANPRTVDFTVTKGPENVQGRLFRAIYLLEGKTLRIAWRKAGEERPKEFVREGQPDVREIFLEKAGSAKNDRGK
jgi:uncharacterized protein (TIGR03067 family)